MVTIAPRCRRTFASMEDRSECEDCSPARSIARLISVAVHCPPRGVVNPAQVEWGGCEVVQDSLRHANARITTEMCTQALTQDKRNAQTKVVRMILPRPSLPL